MGRARRTRKGKDFRGPLGNALPPPLACSFLHITCKRLLRRLTSLPKLRQHKKPRRKSRTKLFSSHWRFSNPLSMNLIILVFHVTLFPRIALLHHLMYKPYTTHSPLICSGKGKRYREKTADILRRHH